MNRLQTALFGLAGGGLLIGGWFAGTGHAQSSGTSKSGSQFHASGRYEVTLSSDSVSTTGMTPPLDDVREISLTTDWAMITHVKGGETHTIVMPRERVRSMTVKDR